jgi:hypothetical protein
MSDSREQGLRGFISRLGSRGGLSRQDLALELAAEMVAAAIESAAAAQPGGAAEGAAEISDVRVEFGEDTVAIAARVRIKGRAWPPRPPLDTELSIEVAEVLAGDEGASGCLICRVHKPLSFSSTFAEMLAGLLGRWMRGIPAPLETLRRKDAILTIDFAAMVRAGRPDLAKDAALVRLHRIKVSPGRVRLEIGFRKQDG